MHNRVYIQKDKLEVGKVYNLSIEESHHLIHVRRFSSGDIIEITCRSGNIFKGIIKKVTHPVEVEISEMISGPFSNLIIHLYYGLTKFKALESAVSRCAELGVNIFTPVICEHSVLTKISSNRAVRLEKLVRESVKQSGQKSVMKIDLTLPSLSDLIREASWDSYDRVFLFLPSSKKKLIEDYSGTQFHKVAVFIGPEGDFSSREVELFQKSSIESNTLGNYVLKSDTAAVAAVSSIRAIWS